MTITTPTPLRLAAAQECSDPDVLARVLGPIDELTRWPLDSIGFSGASFERLHLRLRSGEARTLMLKRVPLRGDWISIRTGDDIGRTAALLAAPDLTGVWEVFHCPYVAYASDGEEMTLLMEDVGEHLFPDERAPLAEEAEDALLGVLALLHARFWEAPALEADWLATVPSRLDLLGPGDWVEHAIPQPPDMLREAIPRGWNAALSRLPPELRRGMTAPGESLAPLWRDLPCTLLHGDTKVANFAVLPDGRVSAFDWSFVGAGPATLDLGWYLAMNATRLARSKQAVMERYRELLEKTLVRTIPAGEWERMADLAVWCGARSMLWSKALALESGRNGAEEEWRWWEDRLGSASLP
jgi:hypothetical protein